MRTGRYGLSVLVDGRPLAETTKDGQHFIAAPEDRDFSLRLQSPFGSRYEIVLSVDGLSVMSGQDATTDERGYILSGTSSIIPGFRLNDSEVARFHFGARKDSYAAKLGKPKNIGVIAAVFYAEKVITPKYSAIEIKEYGAESLSDVGYTSSIMNATVFPDSDPTFSVPRGAPSGIRLNSGRLRAASASVGHDLGTEFGTKAEHKVSHTSFERGEEVARIVLEYASLDSLIKAGVLNPVAVLNPFPADREEVGCRPPSGWTG